MNRTLFHWLRVWTIACFAQALTSSLMGQIPGGQSGFNPALLHLFGPHKGFAGQTELRIMDRANKETVRMPMNMLFLDGKVRAEVNLNQIQSASMGQEGMDMFKKAGMDQVVSVLRPDSKMSIVSFPTAKVFAQEPMTAADIAGFTTKYQVKSVEQGRETIDNHPCVKLQVTVTGGTSSGIQGTVWQAMDLKNFPVKIVLPEGDSIVEMTFKSVKLAKPESSLFDTPAGFEKFESMEKLIQDRLTKVLGKGN